MARMSTESPAFAPMETILSEADLQASVRKVCERLQPRMTGDWTVVSILLGATPFTADLLRYLAGLGVNPVLDALWLESYRDAQESSGRVVVRADLSRNVEGRGVLIVDDVFDSGRTMDFARRHMLSKGAREVITCVLARKPAANPDGLDVWAFDAPDKFLVGYGMDHRGAYRGLPSIGALMPETD